MATALEEQRKDTIRTRRHLLSAASSLFAEKGFRDITIAEICNRAGTNVAAVNYHFGNKKNLYVESWRHSFRETLTCPLYFIPATDDKIFRVIQLVVCTVFAVSLFESIFVLPAHLAHQKEKKRRGLGAFLHSRQQDFSTAFSNWVKNSYIPFLGFVLSNRYLTLTITIAVLALTISNAVSGRMGMEIYPEIESDYARATLIMPYGIAIEKTDALAQRMLQAARQTAAETGKEKELMMEGIFTEIGSGGSHKARMTVYLAPPEVHDTIMGTAAFTKNGAN